MFGWRVRSSRFARETVRLKPRPPALLHALAEPSLRTVARSRVCCVSGLLYSKFWLHFNTHQRHDDMQQDGRDLTKGGGRREEGGASSQWPGRPATFSSPAHGGRLRGRGGGWQRTTVEMMCGSWSAGCDGVALALTAWLCVACVLAGRGGGRSLSCRVWLPSDPDCHLDCAIICHG